MFYSCKITQCTGPTIRKYIAMKVSVTNYIQVLNVSKNIYHKIPLRSAILKYREYFTGGTKDVSKLNFFKNPSRPN